MATYLVTYEWYKSDPLFNIHDALFAYPNIHQLINDSWLIKTDQSAQDIYEHLRPLFLDRDLFVVEVNLEHAAGKVRPYVYPWIQNNK